MPDEKHTPKENSSIVVTLTFSELGTESVLLIQRGDLAHVRQFAYTPETDFTAVIRQAMDALALVENNPPVIPDVPPEKKASQSAPPQPEQPREPMMDIPVKKGKVAIPVSYLKATNGDPGSEEYQQAVLIAGRLIDGKLWDGKSPICIEEVNDVQRKLKRLTDKEMSLFTLEDFARRVTDEEPAAEEEGRQDLPNAADETSSAVDVPQTLPDDEPAPMLPALTSATGQPSLL